MSEARARLEPPDISERGGLKGGQPQRSDERLFMQMFAYTGCDDVPAVAQAVAQAPVDAVVYADLNDPKGDRHPHGRTGPERVRRCRPTVVDRRTDSGACTSSRT